MDKFNKIEDCFDQYGEFIIKDFDPYRTDYEADDDKAELYRYLFDEDGYAQDEPRESIADFISKNDCSVWSDAVKYYYATACIDSNCGGNYTAIYAWRH